MSRRITNMLFGVILSAILLIFSLVSGGFVFGWFASSQGVTANGMSVNANSGEYLEIRAFANGNDISVDVLSKDMETLPLNDTVTDFYPGVSGSFTFFVKNKSENVDSYSFSYKVITENDIFKEDEESEDGFYKGISESEKTLAKSFLQSHIMFFTSKEGDKYSGWINPENTVEAFVNTNEPYESTVYWVWVASYDQIFTENSDLFDEDTRKEIAAYYSKENNHAKLFFNEDVSAESYNTADTLIGVSIKYIYYRIELFKM